MPRRDRDWDGDLPETSLIWRKNQALLPHCDRTMIFLSLDSGHKAAAPLTLYRE
jgi:hypothetical protein